MECRVPAERQNIQDKMSSIRANWPEGRTRDRALKKLSQQLAKLGDACDHESHPDDWFEDPGVGYATDAYWRKNKAKYLCYYECPIRIECLNEGFKVENMAHGTYGGLHVEERQAVVDEMKRRRTPNARTDTTGIPASTGSEEQEAHSEAADGRA